MAGISKQGGQRTNTTGASGQKRRSPTSTPHTGSRVEPSHVADRTREVRERKVAAQGGKKTSPKVAKAQVKPAKKKR